MRLALSFPFLPLPFAGRTKGNALFSATDSSQPNSEGGTFSPSSASVPRRAEDDRRDGRYATPAARMKNDERAAYLPYRVVSYLSPPPFTPGSIPLETRDTAIRIPTDRPGHSEDISSRRILRVPLLSRSMSDVSSESNDYGW